MARLVNIGFGNTVNADKVTAVVGPDAAPIRRQITRNKETGTLIDASAGRKTKAVIFLDNGEIVLSALQPETLSRRINWESTLVSADEEGES